MDRAENLKNNKSAQKKIRGDIVKLPFKDKSMNVVLGRYVLVWNDALKQKRILKEIARIVRGFAIVQHAGADNTKVWQEKYAKLFSGKEISKLKRQGYYFSRRDEIEQYMRDQNIHFERIQNRKVANFSNVLSEKYNLNEEERGRTKKILKEKDFVIQNCWIIYPNKV